MDSMPHNTLQNDKTGFALWYVLLQWFDSSVLLIVLLCVQHWCTVSFVTSGTHISIFHFNFEPFYRVKGHKLVQLPPSCWTHLVLMPCGGVWQSVALYILHHTCWLQERQQQTLLPNYCIADDVMSHKFITCIMNTCIYGTDCEQCFL